MKKIFFLLLAFSFITPASFAKEAGGCLSNGLDSDGNACDFIVPCNPASVSNGVVNQNTCQITCNSGFSLNGTSCVANSSGGGGGGGGGGGSRCDGPIITNVLPVSGSTLPSLSTVTFQVSEVLPETVTVKVDGTELENLSYTSSGTGAAITYSFVATLPQAITTKDQRVQIVLHAEESSSCERNPSFIVTIGDSSSSESETDSSGEVVGAAEWVRECVALLQDKGVVNVGDFRGNDLITRAEATKIVLLSSEAPVTESENSIPFPDVLPPAWYVGIIATAKKLALIEGYSTGLFAPNENLTRAEAVKILILASKTPLLSDLTVPFPDVSSSDWFWTYLVTAYKKGIVNGYPDGTFQPNASITRNEFAKVACGSFGFTEITDRL